MKPQTAHFFLTLMGWKAIEPPVPEPKCVILGVPHTSFWDFVVSYLYYTSVGGKTNIMIKKEFFRWPVKKLLISLGGIPVDRSRAAGAELIMHTIEEFNSRETLHLSIAPEGTRKPVEKWKAGFHKIATAANVPVYLGYFDWKTKTIGRGIKFDLTDDAKADLKRIRQYYKDKGVVGKHPERFALGKDLD
jgi:1-acyl-sn-glycerol-3-phosphate acyltransferase